MAGKRDRWLRLAFVAALCAVSRLATADYAVNMTPGVTSIAHEAYRLHTLAYWICVAIGVVVFGAMGYAIFRFRKSRGAVAAQFHDNPRLEITWTIIPFLILVVLAVPATQALIAMRDTSDADLTVKVTGQQWRWHYEYLDEGVRFSSDLDPKSAEASKLGSGIDPAGVKEYLREVDNPLVLPVGKKIRFLFTATDVIHSWWMPALGYKIDTVPGFINESWARIEQPGTWRGQCAELCGVGHGYMPIVVVAMNEPEFKTWLAQKKSQQAEAAAAADRVWTASELHGKGQEVYVRTCAPCHQPNGKGLPGAFPALDGSALVNGPLAGHLDRVMNGKAGTAMPAFATQLSDADIAAVVTYERNAWGNKTGDAVQPAQVKQARR